MDPTNLPRLLYIGDVPIESITAGGAQLYKLLKEYPAPLLRVAQGRDLAGYQRAHRLPGVKYDEINFGWPRLFITRFVSAYSRYLFWRAPRWRYKLRYIMREFQPQAILAVAHRHSWIVADLLAREYQIPLHLIVHDDVVRMACLTESDRPHVETKLGEVYKRAASRLCVCPQMMQVYKRKFGCDGTVFYPGRGAEMPSFNTISPRLAGHEGPLQFAFAGSINYAGYGDMLGRFAAVLERLGHRLLIFGGLSDEAARIHKLDRPHVTRFPMMPMDELVHTMRREVDAFMLPMTFRPDLAYDMEISFPSKLTDYTAIGVPILVWGPPYCSGIHWARDNSGIAQIVDTDDDAALASGVRSLAGDPERRAQMAARGMEFGDANFSRSRITQQFLRIVSDAFVSTPASSARSH